MTVTTIFLMLVLAALAAAHILLYFGSRQQETGGSGAVSGALAALAADAGMETAHAQDRQAQSPQPHAHEKPVADTDLKAMGRRMDTLEKLLLTNGNSVLAYNLKEKLHKLDNFRANTTVELAGIKEILAEMQNGTAKKAAPKRNSNGSGMVTEDLRKIVYRSRKSH